MLVNCVAYTEGRKLADIPVEDISEYLKRPNCFVWVALKDPEPSELEMMQDEFVLGEVHIFVGPNYILSTRRRTAKGFADVRARCEREPDLLQNGSGYVL